MEANHKLWTMFPGFPDQVDHNLTILWHHTRTDNPGQPTGGHRTSHRSPTGGHRTSHRSPTGGHRGGNDTFCGGQGWTTGGHHKMDFFSGKTTAIRS